MMHLDLIGQRFGLLKVSSSLGKIGKYYMWSCDCDCGGRRKAATRELRHGLVKSCGCLRVKNSRAMLTTHGLSDRPEHYLWMAMRQRCSNPKNKSYANYGGRGIRVCDRWRTFEAFYADMGPRPSDLHTLERINNDGDYGPDNCVWATRAVQGSNTRRNRYIEFQGETKTLEQWSSVFRINSTTIAARIQRGWTLEKALTAPVMTSGAAK